MERIGYKQAKTDRLKSYFTGEPCIRGHIAPRRTASRACTECQAEDAKRRYDESLCKDKEYVAKSRERARKWARENPEANRARNKEWREKNGQRQKEYSKRWHEINRGKQRQRDREKQREYDKNRYADPKHGEAARKRTQQWRKLNRAHANSVNKRWRDANPDRVKAIQITGWINRRARQRDAGQCSLADIKTVRADGKCAVCGRTDGRMEIDHVIALSRGGRHHVSNLQLLCRPCNRSKWATDLATWVHEHGYSIKPR